MQSGSLYRPVLVKAKALLRHALLRGPVRRMVIDSFHFLWYWQNDSWQKNTFLGLRINQLPFDIWLYQEIVFRHRPDVIVQTGVQEGGSILFFAHLLDMIGSSPDALVIGIDIKLLESARQIRHPRVRLLEGDSVSAEIVGQTRDLCGGRQGLVSLDSQH